MPDSPARPIYTRADIDCLTSRDRAGVLAALGSFDDRGMAETDFVRHAAGLLDPARVDGLAAAGLDPQAILAAVASAARQLDQGVAEPLASTPGHVNQAEEVLAHRFCFYGETHQLPADIDWDHNPGTGHWGHDLNRFSYLTPLWMAHGATGDDRYGRKAVELILDWVAKADFGRAFGGTAYAFGSYLNQAIHCEVWAVCLRRLLPSGLVPPLELLRILKSLHEQLAYLEVVTAGHHGNWPTIGIRGMLATLAALPLLRDTDRFTDYSLGNLADQVAEQVLPDGVQDELTPHYHRVVINNLLSAAGSAAALGRQLDAGTVATLRKMIHYQQQTTVPDGSAQAGFNDSDPAVVGDPGPALARAGLADLLSPPEALGPEVFPYAGVALLRQRQDEGDLYLAFDGGPYGRSHQHEDMLGFWLHAYGRNLLVDPGRHLYDSSAASYRDYLCSTRAHSTILIDGQGQHARGRPGTWIAAEPVPLDWHSDQAEIRAAAAYDLGYGEDNAIAVTHRREVVFARQRFWVIFDWVAGSGQHAVESRFQFAPGPVSVDEGGAHTGFPDANLMIRSVLASPNGEEGGRSWPQMELEVGREDPRGGWYSASYGQIEPAPCLALRVSQPLPLLGATLLWPYRGEKTPDVQLALDADRATVKAPGLGVVTLACRSIAA